MDSESDYNASDANVSEFGFTPPSKKTKMANGKAKTAAAGAAKKAPAAKKTAAASKKPLAPNTETNKRSNDDDDSAFEAGSVIDVDDADSAFDPDSPAKPKAKASGSGKAKTATETYQKLTQLEHILKRPDTYIGSVEKQSNDLWVYDKNAKMMSYRKTQYVPGFYKIFDEILVNAADNKVRAQRVLQQYLVTCV